MTTSASSFPAALPESTYGSSLHARRSAVQESSLASLVKGSSALVVSVVLEPAEVAWLAAVGISVGDRLTVLRQAAFGGPIHVRTRAGGEFALARSLARAVLVRHQP